MKKRVFLILAFAILSSLMIFGTLAVAEDTAVQSADAYTEALSAYRSAKQSSRMADYEQELKDMVAGGQLTQEQADLLLKASTDSAALRSGTCPNCGYEFETQRGGKGGMRKGGHGRH